MNKNEEAVLILEKITYLKEVLNKLKKRYDKYEIEVDIEEKETLFAAMCKYAEEVVEIAIKINNKFLELNKDFASSYYDTFIKLSKHYDLDIVLIEKLAKTTGLRNRIAHEYEFIDEKITLNSINNILQIYPKYISIVNNLLKK